jgi:hypothetical protein
MKYRAPAPDKDRVDALRAQGKTYRAIALELNSNYSAVRNVALAPSSNGATPATITEPKNAAVHSQCSNGADQLADHETRLQGLEAFMATVQAQCRDSAVQAPAQNSMNAWQDPADAKPARWNLWIPRGLRRLIEEQAKSAGIVPSKYVQSLL